MKSVLLKIIFCIVIIVIVVFGLEKIFFKKDKVIETSTESNEISKTNTVAKTQENKQENEDKIYNALIIGNSLTIERDGIGMAASDEYHDYYYLTKTRLENKYKNVNMNRISAIHWEENRIISSRTDWINENLTPDKISDMDLVIFQLGDNCVPTESFEKDTTELVNHVKKYSPNAKLLLIGMWFINEDRMALMPKIAKDLNMEFIDITDLVVDENKSHIGQEVIGIDGKKDSINTIEEAFHPSDIGMKKIADRICNKLGI